MHRLTTSTKYQGPIPPSAHTQDPKLKYHNHLSRQEGPLNEEATQVSPSSHHPGLQRQQQEPPLTSQASKDPSSTTQGQADTERRQGRVDTHSTPPLGQQAPPADTNDNLNLMPLPPKGMIAQKQAFYQRRPKKFVPPADDGWNYNLSGC